MPRTPSPSGSRRYRRVAVTYTVAREHVPTSGPTLSSPQAAAELARELLAAHDDDREHVWSAPGSARGGREMEGTVCAHVSGLFVEPFTAPGHDGDPRGPGLDHFSGLVLQPAPRFRLSGPPVDCVAISVHTLADVGGSQPPPVLGRDSRPTAPMEGMSRYCLGPDTRSWGFSGSCVIGPRPPIFAPRPGRAL
jgi:hypothetical protein